MPFLGQDWRSPGEQWVRTTDGWERLKLWRLKLLQNISENVITRLLKLNDLEELMRYKDMEGIGSQPYVYVLRPGISREVAVHTSTSEALSRLQVLAAVKDPKRFNYVCKLLENLVECKLCTLSGTAQRYVFNVIDEMVKQVMATQNNVNRIQKLLDKCRSVLENGQMDHVGSSILWEHHTQSVNCTQKKLDSLTLNEREDDGKLMLSDLPDDVIRIILHKLHDHRDLVFTGRTHSRTYDISEENRFWYNLCTFHFPSNQWRSVVRRGEDLESLGWKMLYSRLSKRFGLRDVYAETLELCQRCNALYWEGRGHPCPFSEIPCKSMSISPAMCVELFTN